MSRFGEQGYYSATEFYVSKSKTNLRCKIMEEIKTDSASQEEGEEQLFVLIKEAGNEARNRRKKTLDEHFNKLNKIIKNAASHIQAT